MIRQYRGKDLNMTYFSKKFPKNWNKLNKNFWSYLAGFIDGDGSIYVRLVKTNNILNYKIIVSLGFFQHKKYYFLLERLWKIFNKEGHLRIRPNSEMADLVISNKLLIKQILTKIYPFLIIKKPQAKLVLKIINDNENIKLLSKEKKRATFLEVCKKIDKVAKNNNSKNRKNTYESVKESYSTSTCRDLEKKFPDN